MLPLVSCIMPTYNRREFIPHAIRYFLRQDYEDKELIIIDDGDDSIQDLVPVLSCIKYHRLPSKITLGAKLNMACRYARGNIIANWDDDDWYAVWRLRYQVESMISNGKQICGINKLLYYDLRDKAAYQYVYPSNQRVWLLGSSLLYTKDAWNNNQFADIDVGMDGLFVWNAAEDSLLVLPDNRFSVHMIHKANVSPKNVSGSWWHFHPEEDIKKIMGHDWQFYSNGSIHYPIVNGYQLPFKVSEKKASTLKNVYACLVHKQQDCVLDLVRNLYYHDPDSTILLYNGGTNPNLIPPAHSLSQFGAVAHPSPSPVKHGYLHTFALHCMQFALDNFDADIITMIDSDQLCIRKGYTNYMSQFFSTTTNTGMLSSAPQPISRDTHANPVALQAFKEYELWKPLLNQFKDGKEKFVHWTFWPSSVFTADAAQDLLKLFNENEILKNIMLKSSIWASEEVILPTLVSLLGYQISANPCNYDLVRYRQPVSAEELNKASNTPDLYWVHPVARNYDDPIRKLIRSKCNNYAIQDNIVYDNELTCPDNFSVEPILDKIKHIEGWLSDAEADMLICTAIRAFSVLSPPNYIIEVGSYHGKSTILFGNVIKEICPEATIVSIDMHDGKVGAVDQGLKKFPPSLVFLKKNIDEAGLADVVKIKQGHSYDIEWNSTISLLFIDGLHDYDSVRKDFNHFSVHIARGGYVVFHDYADYYPGVKKLVGEILQTNQFRKIKILESLIVLQKS